MKRSTFYSFLKKPWVAGLSTFMILLFITQYVAYQTYLINENEQKNIINNQVSLIKEKLQALVRYSYSATKLLATIVERNGIPPDFDNIAIELLERSKYFDVVELVDANGFITHVYPLKDNDVIGFNIMESPEARRGALATIERKGFFIAGPVHLKQGGVGMISRRPIFINGKFSGFSAVVTTLSTFFNDQDIGASIDNRFIYQLSSVNLKTKKEEFFLERDMSLLKGFSVPIEMSYGEWKLYVALEKPPLNTAIWFALLGFIIAILGSWVVWFFAGQSTRLNKLINIQLIKQESQLKLIHETSREQIKTSESNLNKAQQIAKIGSWDLDIKTNNLSWSEEMFRIFERDPEKFEVTRETMLHAIHPDDRDLVFKAKTYAVKNNKPYQIIYRLKFDKDRLKYVEEQCETFNFENQASKRLFGTIQDITERIENEKVLLNYKNNLEKTVSLRTEELNDSKEALLNLLEDLNFQSEELQKEKVKAQSADLMKSAFLATMSHELRTPMNSIIGFTGILLKEFAGPLNEEQKKQLSMVKNSGHHLLGLINDILDISKIEAGKLKVSKAPFSYLSIVEKTIEFLLPQANKKELSISTEFSETKIILDSDERRVEQVLLNLISNAIKFSNQGTIVVKVDINNNFLTTQIIDQGIGISKVDLNKLFIPFIQLDGGLSRSQEGTGLGLAISKNLIEKLGGTIQATSKIGEGSNFTFKLPIE